MFYLVLFCGGGDSCCDGGRGGGGCATSLSGSACLFLRYGVCCFSFVDLGTIRCRGICAGLRPSWTLIRLRNLTFVSPALLLLAPSRFLFLGYLLCACVWHVWVSCLVDVSILPRKRLAVPLQVSLCRRCVVVEIEKRLAVGCGPLFFLFAFFSPFGFSLAFYFVLFFFSLGADVVAVLHKQSHEPSALLREGRDPGGGFGYGSFAFCVYLALCSICLQHAAWHTYHTLLRCSPRPPSPPLPRRASWTLRTPCFLARSFLSVSSVDGIFAAPRSRLGWHGGGGTAASETI